ncbi:MAG: hypothetical protein ACREF3_07180 [Acetobacteraceae bacterium]
MLAVDQDAGLAHRRFDGGDNPCLKPFSAKVREGTFLTGFGAAGGCHLLGGRFDELLPGFAWVRSGFFVCTGRRRFRGRDHFRPWQRGGGVPRGFAESELGFATRACARQIVR